MEWQERHSQRPVKGGKSAMEMKRVKTANISQVDSLELCHAITNADGYAISAIPFARTSRLYQNLPLSLSLPPSLSPAVA